MRILVVEDEPHIARLIKEGLVSEAFAVDICHNGEDGLLAAQTDCYDAVILDRMLPGGVDGLELCKTLRHEGNHTPVLLLTARDHVHDRIAGLNGGADDYLVKPYAFDELLARLRAILRRPATALSTVLHAADLEMDTVAKQVRRRGQLIKLSPTEYALLEHLLRNKGTVVSKESLIQHVWDFDADILPSTVEVFIVYLRAKVDKPFAGPRLIKTVRGYGYSIRDNHHE